MQLKHIFSTKIKIRKPSFPGRSYHRIYDNQLEIGSLRFFGTDSRKHSFNKTLYRFGFGSDYLRKNACSCT